MTPASLDDRFRAGLRAFKRERFFDAHEHWEDVWRDEPDPATRSAIQGLVQLAASLHKAQRGERAGFEKLWAKARGRLVAGRDAVGTVRGVELAKVIEAMDAARRH